MKVGASIAQSDQCTCAVWEGRDLAVQVIGNIDPFKVLKFIIQFTCTDPLSQNSRVIDAFEFHAYTDIFHYTQCCFFNIPIHCWLKNTCKARMYMYWYKRFPLSYKYMCKQPVCNSRLCNSLCKCVNYYWHQCILCISHL